MESTKYRTKSINPEMSALWVAFILSRIGALCIWTYVLAIHVRRCCSDLVSYIYDLYIQRISVRHLHVLIKSLRMIQRPYLLRSIVPNISNIEIKCLGNLGESILKDLLQVNVKTTVVQAIDLNTSLASPPFLLAGYQLPSSHESHLHPSKHDPKVQTYPNIPTFYDTQTSHQNATPQCPPPTSP